MLLMILLIAWYGGSRVLSQRTTMANTNTVLSHGIGFEGQARIICSENSIGVEVTNVEGKDGRLFARKMSETPNCVKHYSSTDKTVRLDVAFNFLLCGVKSRRMTHPRPGVEYSMVVILSYGRQLTEDDQMFSLSCRYFSNRREIGTVMEVSTFSKSYLVGGRNGPACEYSLHYGSLNGPPAENARIGDRVYHEWKCADSSFALKVYDCFVHDGQNRKYKLLDDQGCTVDKTILPELTYDPALNHAFAASRVFKFAEATKMFFNCLLYMCPKSDPICRKSVPPNCNRKKRSIPNPTSITTNHLYTVNASLPFDPNSASTRSFEPESIEESIAIGESSEQGLERLEVLTTTQLIPTTTNLKVVESKKVSTDGEKTAILPAPVIEFQPISTTLAGCSAQARNSVKVILVGLVACNLVLLTVSTIAIAALCRRHTSAQLDLASRSYSNH